MQKAGKDFYFDIILDSYNFKRYEEYAKRSGLVSNICSLEEIEEEPENVADYCHVVQKSDLWFHLRSKATCTASTVGKLIKGPPLYPTWDQVNSLWKDKLTQTPFSPSHATKGHMKWGVKYEDVAQIHFSVENNLPVTQVGTVYLPMKYILSIMKDYFTEEERNTIQDTVLPSFEGEHFLVSPDGLIEGIGMLEIKCISPFHHVENEDNTLSWAIDMESRQWYDPSEIPYVYITQICMQALSGLCRFNMDENNIMWFIRWSPKGFSEFKIKFKRLIRMGIISTVLYLVLKSRIKNLSDLPFKYIEEEMPIKALLDKAYREVIEDMEHRYVSHELLYPEFFLYRKITEEYKFEVS